MNWVLYAIIILFFLIGGIGIYFINKKKDAESKRQNWIKYFAYFIIIHILFFSMSLSERGFSYVSLLIITVGCIELINLQLKQNSLKTLLFLSILFIYGICSVSFLLFTNSSKEILLFTLFIVCFFDAFSQISGQLFGKKKMTPKLSPNKTYEGFAGGMIISLIMSQFVGALLGFSIYYTLSFGFIICVSAFGGDLSASWVKRKYHVKDFSRIIPGHGGFLDRFDSLIVAGAFVYLFNLILKLR